MPYSDYGGSVSSLSSPRRGPAYHYHTIAPVSEVDESLFGFSTAFKRDADGQTKNGGIGETPLEREAADRGRKRNGNAAKSPRKKKTVEVVTRDEVRSLVVPEETDTEKTLLLRSSDFERIRDSARVTSEQEKRKEAERLRAIQEELEGMETRRSYMQGLDMRRRKNRKANEIEEEKRRKREVLTQRAIEQLHEQEDEIKRLNELIHGAKVLSIRDSQVAEKKAIDGERQAEDRRIDRAMELDRRNAVRMEEEIEKKRKEERFHGATQIMEQIEDNEQDRLNALTRKDVENREMRKRLDRLCDEEELRIRKHRKDQEQLRQMLNQCNADLQHRRQLSREQENLLERRVVEFQRQKAEREEAFEKEQARIRLEKDKEVARLRALQEQSRDERAERDAIRAKRAAERTEQEWRQKVALEEKRKMETAAMLERSRAEQLKQKQHFLAVEAQRERAEFERILRAQEALQERQKLTNEEKAQRRKEFSRGLRVQIRDKEQDRVRERNEFFDEAIRVEDEIRQRRQQLEEIKRRKLHELREAGIHDKYVSQIERRVNQPHYVATM